jgi:hypothetical protein
MLTALPWILFAFGLFYTLGGVVLVRRMAMDRLLDQAIAAITLKRDRVEETATRLLTIGGWLTFASGLSLMAQSRAALVIFILNILAQGGYLAWAARHRPVTDEAERRGRASTRNALLIYVGVFALVVVMEQHGLWRSWLGTGIAGLVADLVAIGAVTVTFIFLLTNTGNNRSGKKGKRYPDFLDPGEDEAPDYDPTKPPSCLRLAPEYQCWPLWDDESGTNVNPDRLGLSADLVARIERWDAVYQKCYRPDDPMSSGFQDVAEERFWADESEVIWDTLCEEWEGELANWTSRLQHLMTLAFMRVNTFDLPQETKVAEMAAQCGVVEIREMLRRLDTLAEEWDRVETWDGDSQDDIARLQTFFARVLAQVAPRYRDDVAAGLKSPHEATRRWVQLALDGQAG